MLTINLNMVISELFLAASWKIGFILRVSLFLLTNAYTLIVRMGQVPFVQTI